MNHLEQLVTEWFEYLGHFVKTSVNVGKRERGGYDGELDVVSIDIVNRRIIHVECGCELTSVDKWNERYAAKFERGRKFIPQILPAHADWPIEQVSVLMFNTSARREFGGVRSITYAELVKSIEEGLVNTRLNTSAVPSQFGLVRAIQMAMEARTARDSGQRLLAA